MDHKKQAITLFNETWDLIDKLNKTPDDEALMIHKAHASLYHWMQVGTPLNFQRGEWMVSHVYALLGRQEPALYHAERMMKLTKEHQIDDFDLTFAYEALARAYAINKDAKGKEYLEEGYASLDSIKKKDDRTYCKSQLDEIKFSSLL